MMILYNTQYELYTELSRNGRTRKPSSIFVGISWVILGITRMEIQDQILSNSNGSASRALHLFPIPLLHYLCYYSVLHTDALCTNCMVLTGTDDTSYKGVLF